jgi:hypothetical protein
MNDAKDRERIFADKGAFVSTVRLARVQVEGLGDAELKSALAYEVEPYSSVPAAEAEVAWRRIESGDAAVEAFEVAVVRRRKDGVEEKLGRCLKPLTAAAALALLAMAADYAVMARARSRLESSLARRLPLQEELDRIDRRAASLRDRAGKLRLARETAAEAQNECARLRSAFAGFTDAVSELDGASVLKSVEEGEGEFSLGLAFASVDERSAAAAMAELTASLARKGWDFIPEGISPAGAGGTVEFRGKAVFRR